MLAHLKRAGRRCIALVWAMALVFAAAPAVAMASATAAGEFSRFFMHAHGQGEDDHHHGHHHFSHVHDGEADHHHDGEAGHHHHGSVGDTPGDDSRQPGLHVHFDACCPSVLVPVQAATLPRHLLAGRMAVARFAPLRGAPPDRLLRPPIPTSPL